MDFSNEECFEMEEDNDAVLIAEQIILPKHSCLAEIVI
jgi:hypothetical protein